MEPPKNKLEILELFRQGPSLLADALTGLNEEELDYIPSNGGWSIRQIIHHIVDGDDLWKTCVKIALGNEQAEFTLQWYWAHPQTEWAEFWRYEERPIDPSLALLKANRDHVIQLLEYAHDGWSKCVQFRKFDGQIEPVPVGAAIKIQADHVVHHIKRITAIREEISNK